ncbi:hypothetical protein B0G69_6637 [Paraburkholderia sp. RAU2J]|nr:hypothetical protein B0G69_6637 [Paraburkholderia sp. RAU2J]
MPSMKPSTIPPMALILVTLLVTPPFPFPCAVSNSDTATKAPNDSFQIVR